MIRLARFLPLLTVAALAVTTVVPIMVGTVDYLSVNSFGYESPTILEADWPFVAVWVTVLTLAVSAWLLRSLKLWSGTAVVVALALALHLVDILRNPPVLLWDGVSDDGKPIGGMETAVPGVGTLMWATGILALLAAGVLGLIGTSRTEEPPVS